MLSGIKNNPGIRYRELVRTTGIPNSTIGYYIKKLEKNQQISVQRTSKSCRFFMPELLEIQRLVVVMLRGKNTRGILLALKKEDKISFSSLVKHLKSHPSTVSINLKKLVNAKMIEKIGKDQFAIKNKNTIKIICEFESKTLLFVSLLCYNVFQFCTEFVLFDFGGYT